MSQIWHMPKLLDMHLCGEYADIHTIYEVTPINNVARIAVHIQRRRRRRQSPITYTELATWTNQSKK